MINNTQTKKMNVEEIREILINEHEFSQEQVNNIKGKSNLVNTLLSLTKEDDMNNDSFTITGLEPLEETKILTRLDKGWTQYILNQLEEDEKDNNYPKACGLLRLLEREISQIQSIETEIIQFPNPGNGMISTVKSKIVLQNGENYTACADTQKSDLEYPYDRHVTAVCESRAEARVYRKALRLKNVVTREEMIDKKEEHDDKINKTQINIIENLCMNDRLNINVNKLLKSLFEDKVKTNVWQYTHEEAVLITKKLTEYQVDMTKIPDEFRGYSPDWK